MKYLILSLILLVIEVNGQTTNVELNIQFDNRPRQSAWRITNANGQIVYSGYGTTDLAYSSQEYLYPLECGSYSFTFFDRNGNENDQDQGNQGIIGSWQLTLEDGTVLAQQDDYDWDFFQSKPFQIGYSNCNDIYSLSLDIEDCIYSGENTTVSSSFSLNENLDFTFLGQIGGNYYYRSNYTETWYAAEAIALALGGNLVSITSDEESNLFDYIDEDIEKTWIGLIQRNWSQNQAGNVSWEWSNGEQINTFTNWNLDIPEPNNSASNTFTDELFLGFNGNNNNSYFRESYESAGEIWGIGSGGTASVWNDDNFSKERFFAIEIEPSISWSNGSSGSNITINLNENTNLLATLSVGEIQDVESVDLIVVESNDNLNYETCATEPLFNQISTTNVSGSWSGPSALVAGHLGVFLYSIHNYGTYTYSFNNNNGCQESFPITISPFEPNAGNDNIISICKDDDSINLFEFLGSEVTVNGTWSPNLANGYLGTFNPNSNFSGSYTYTVYQGECSDNSSVEVNVLDVSPSEIQQN